MRESFRPRKRQRREGVYSLEIIKIDELACVKFSSNLTAKGCWMFCWGSFFSRHATESGVEH